MISINPMVPQLPVSMPHLRKLGMVCVLLKSSSCHLFSTVLFPVCCYLPFSLQQELIHLSSLSCCSAADSWLTSRRHLHTDTSQLAEKLSAHSAELSSGLHLLRKALLHRGHSSVLLYYKNTQSKYFHKQLEGSKI